MKSLLIFIILICSTFCCCAQLNFGLTQPQDSSTLPQTRSKNAPLLLSQKVGEPIKNELTKITVNQYMVNSQWYMLDGKNVRTSTESPLRGGVNIEKWYRATVPGTVLTTLVDQGVYPDPYFGLNNLNIPDTLCRMDWWYRTEFMLPVRTSKDELIELTFDGINYRAEVWLNNTFLGTINGAFSRGRFNVTDIAIKDKLNTLAVRIIPPSNPGIPHEKSRFGHGPNGGTLCLDGPTFISSEGWDWVPGIRDRNIGIWQNVSLAFNGPVTVEDPHIITDLPLPDTSSVNLNIKLCLVNHAPKLKNIKLNLKIEGVNITKSYTLKAHEKRNIILSTDEFHQLKMKNPRLWWPNGYGQQNLYNADFKVSDDSGSESHKSVRFGVRELEYGLAVNTQSDTVQRIMLNPISAYSNGIEIIDRINRVKLENNMQVPSLLCSLDHSGITSIDSKSTSLVIYVNGEKIFCKGGNWGMDDAMKRVSKDRLLPYFQLQKAQNFNMIRNWTGESTEAAFYELCDEYGMLVFNDFWMSTEGFNLPPSDNKLFSDNVKEVVTRYRNHPSIAIWCARNEGFAPDKLEHSLTKILAQEDGTRYYIGNSRTLNTQNSGPWDFKTEKEYFDMAKGFSSEIGTAAVPTFRSLRKMMHEEDLWPIGDVWNYHDWHNAKWPDFNLFESYIDSIYGKSNNAEMFCDISQIQNYDSFRSIFEGWNSKMWSSTTGVLLWMSHPAWPSTIWQTYSWDYETTGAYYGCKKACEPLHIQWNQSTNHIQVVNASAKKYEKLTMKYCLYSLDGELIKTEEDKISICPNSVNARFDMSKLPFDGNLYLLRLTLSAGRKILSDNDYWISEKTKNSRSKLLSLPNTEVKITDRKQKINRYEFIIENASKTIAVGIKLSLKNKKTDNYILPAIFSDGYFTLLPGEKRKMFIDRELQPDEDVIIEGLNISK